MNTSIALGTKACIERINAAYDRVHAAWQQSVEDILALGKELLDARELLAKGEYTNMLHNQLKFSAATATRVIKIAENEKIFSHVKILPPHWGTLYHLSRLDDATFDKAIEAGVIRPDMERSEVPPIPRNLSAHGRPLGRPRKPTPPTIEGTATEVLHAHLTRVPGRTESVDSIIHPPPPAEPVEDDLIRLVTTPEEALVTLRENEAEERKRTAKSPAPEPEPFGIQVTLSPTNHARNFWQALLILLGEWEKLGSLDGLVPDEETERLLVQYDLGRFIDDLDMLRVALLEDPDAALKA